MEKMELRKTEINHVIFALVMKWHKYPYLRLGQLLVNAIEPEEPCSEVFYISDEDLHSKLEGLKIQDK